jgi:hypothetical protein
VRFWDEIKREKERDRERKRDREREIWTNRFVRQKVSSGLAEQDLWVAFYEMLNNLTEYYLFHFHL